MPRSAGGEVPQRGPCDVGGAAEVGGDGGVEQLGGQVDEASVRERAGAVDDGVHASETSDGRVEQPVDRMGVPDVDGRRHHRPGDGAAVEALVPDRVQHVGGARAEHEPVAPAREPVRDGPSDAAAGARDEDDATCSSAHGLPLRARGSARPAQTQVHQPRFIPPPCGRSTGMRVQQQHHRPVADPSCVRRHPVTTHQTLVEPVEEDASPMPTPRRAQSGGRARALRFQCRPEGAESAHDQ